MPTPLYRYGQPVLVNWGTFEVPGTVERIYGDPDALRLVIRLEPEESGYIVDESTTVAVNVEDVRPIEPAA